MILDKYVYAGLGSIVPLPVSIPI